MGTENNGMNQVKGLKEGLGGEQHGRRTKGGGHTALLQQVGGGERRRPGYEDKGGSRSHRARWGPLHSAWTSSQA